ncbi:MAG: TRAP transporter substrate-binding protein [Rhodobacteraceae bacterium]|nr:TRAP transporter substrate-binding protein [Paracoccaceae bacterium]
MRITRFVLSAATAGMFSLATQTASAEELSVATFVPPNHETVTGMFAWFSDEIEKRSGGSLTMKLYPAGQLGAGPVQQYKRTIEGVADITFGVAAYTPTIFPKTMLAILPGKANTSVESTRRIWGVFDENLADEFSEVKVLAVGTVAGSIFVGTKDVSTLEGLEGAKLVPFAAMTTPVIEGLGAVPVQMPITEMHTGLSTGTIDVVTTSLNSLMPPWNLADVAEYAVENVPVSFQVTYVIMNNERYEGLSDAHKAIIDELAGLPMSLELAKSFDRADDIAREMLETTELNYQWVFVSDGERMKMDAAVINGMDAIYADYAARGISNAQEIYEALNR